MKWNEPLSSRLRCACRATSALRCPKNAAHIRLLAFFVLPPFVRFADISPAGGIFRCGNSGFASERLAALAVPGPVSRRPANGAAAEIPVTLFLPPAARNRNPATGSAKPQFPRRGRQDAPVRHDTGDGGDPSAPVCALGHLPFQGRQDAAARHDSLGQFLHSFISEATSFLHFPGG